MRNVADKSYRRSQNTHFTFNKLLFPENLAVCEIMGEKWGRGGQATGDKDNGA
jgi:hypothetical protein